VIGIVAQPLSDYMTNHKDPKEAAKFVGYKTYIQAAYVKWLEASGARVVPLY
jgi:hypothetical protein